MLTNKHYRFFFLQLLAIFLAYVGYERPNKRYAVYWSLIPISNIMLATLLENRLVKRVVFFSIAVSAVVLFPVTVAHVFSLLAERMEVIRIKNQEIERLRRIINDSMADRMEDRSYGGAP